MEATRITLVPHTHWDREWYQPFDEFRDRLVAMMDALIEAGNRGFPHFHLDGQTAMIDDYLEVRPEREPDIKRLAAERRLSLGPWFTQMDEFLTSGESHIRNLELGLARARELGPPLQVGYLPDQFGHIGQMPQILKQAGIERAVVWRGVPSVIDKDAFWWEAPDGSRVLTEYMAFGYFNAQDGNRTFDRIADPEELARAMEHAVERQRSFMASERMLVMMGYDHAGPDTTFPERLAAARPHLRAVHAEVGGLHEHLAAQRLGGQPPVWRGELRSSARAHLLPNVYSARVHQKRERGCVEALLERTAEPLAALVPRVRWPAAELDRAWTLLLWNGAHDSACGCSHDQVARDVDARFAEARMLAETIRDRALGALGLRVRDPGVIRFNPSSFEREGVPGLGWRVDPAPVEPAAVPASVTVRDGWIAADKFELTLKDEPDHGDLYNYCHAQEGQVPVGPRTVAVDGQTVSASFEGVEVELRVSRRADEPFLRIDGRIDNERPDHRLRLHVRLPEVVTAAVAGSPFELVERGLVSEGSSLESASPTWPARGVVLAGGVALFAQGVIEYEIVDGRELAVTVLRCVGTISRMSLSTRPWPAGPDVATPDAQLIGPTLFSFALLPGAHRDELMTNWERFALPLSSRRATGGGSLPSVGRLLEISGDAVLSSIRRVNGAVQVRLWNASAEAPAEAQIGGRAMTLTPAEIRMIRLA